MIRLFRIPALILLIAAPALLFAQEQPAGQEQAAGGRMIRRMSELIGSPVSHTAGTFEAVIRDVVLTADGALTHLVIEFTPGVAAQPGAPGVPPNQAAPPGAAQDPTQAPGQEPDAAQDGTAQDRAAQPAPGTAVPGAVAPALVRHLVPIERATFGGPDQITSLDLNAEELEGLPVLPEADGLPADIGDGGAEARHILGTRLRDFTFVDSQGEQIGGVDDIVLDLEQHRVAYIALATGGFLGLGQALHAIPMDAVTELNTEEEQIVVGISREQLDEREGFDANNWPAEAPAWDGAAEDAPTGQQQPQQQ